MNLYQYLSAIPMEHLSILQANEVLHKHTMRDLQIYRDFLRLKRDKAKIGGNMQAYAECEKLSGYGDTVCRGAIRKMQTELPENVLPPKYLTQSALDAINNTIAQDF